MLVTVIIPTFNRRRWIGECLDSVLAQTHSDIEVVVVDDCSSDGTVEWLRSQPRYGDVIVHRQKRNGGASIARNTGLEIARGQLIVFIDSDDLLLPNHVEAAVGLFSQNLDLGLFCCDSKMIDADGNVIADGKTWHEAVGEMKNYPVKTGYRSFADVFAFSNCFPGFTLRREVFEELGGFDQTIFPADDYDLALRVAASDFKVFYLHEPLCLRREHDGQLSGVQNSVKTQRQLIGALQRAAKGTESALSRSVIRNRIADLKLELGMSLVKEGSVINGIRTMIVSIASRPAGLRALAQVGRRRVGRIVSAGN